MTETELSEKLAELPGSEAARERQSQADRRRMRRINRIKKNDALLRITRYGGYAPHRGYFEGEFDGNTLLHSGKYIKYPNNDNYQRRMKKATSRRTRSCKELPKKGNYYRRLYEYWWALY